MAWMSARCALRSTPPRNEVISTEDTRPALTVATALYRASPLQLTDGISGLPILVQTMPAVTLAGRGGAGGAAGTGAGWGRISVVAGGATWVDWIAGAGGAGAVTWNSGGGTNGGGGALMSGGGGTTFSGGGGGFT